MLKSTNKVFASSSLPIMAYSNGEKTKIRSYIDKESNTVILSNFSELRPRSPISGSVMVPNIKDRYIRNLTSKDFESLVNVATCPKCGKKLYTSKSIAAVLSKAHCIHCGELFDIEDGKDYYNKLGELIDEVDTEIKHKTPDEVVESATKKDEKEDMKEKDKNKKDEKEGKKAMKKTVSAAEIDSLIDEVLSESKKKEDKKDKKSKEVEEQAKNKEKAECAVEDIKVDMLSTVSSFDDLSVIPSGSENFHYIMANKKPVAMLHKFRAISAVADMFENLPTLENTLKESVQEKKGFTREIKSSFGIVPVIMKIKASKVIDEKINKKVAEIEANAQKKIEDATESYNQCLGIATAGLNKDAFDDCNNVLANELIKKFNAVGVEDAETIVKATFEAHANEYLLQIINKANTFKNKSLEERNEIASKVINFSSKESKITPSMIENIEAVEDAKQKEASDISAVLFGK